MPGAILCFAGLVVKNDSPSPTLFHFFSFTSAAINFSSSASLSSLVGWFRVCEEPPLTTLAFGT
jgi:hypothetical protein